MPFLSPGATSGFIFHLDKVSSKPAAAHLPQVWAKMGAGTELFKLPASYEKAINGVRISFYNPAMAAKASTWGRV